MIHYCLGFAFTRDYANYNRVLLIRKLKPDWQAGRLNGIGGKIEAGETPLRAMIREFKEECGLDSDVWEKFAELEFPDARIHCMVTWYDWKTFKRATSTTEEKICSYELDDRFFEKLNEEKALLNLHWLIPAALARWYCNSSTLLVKEISKGQQ